MANRGQVRREESRNFSALVPDERVYEFINLQKAVKQWIEEVLSIKLQDDLHPQLKRGVILCYLMKQIEENAIPRIQESTDTPFKLKENISFFLEAVEDFGVPKHKIFLVDDLWENKSIVNVVICLAALAERAAEKGFKPTIKIIPDDPKSRPTLDIKAKEQLRQLLAKVREKPTAARKPKEGSGIARLKIALLAGNGVDMVKFEKKWAKVQALIRTRLQRKKYQRMVRDVAYREKIAKEILSTEVVYVKALKACIDNYYKPLEEETSSKKPLLTKEQLKRLFSDIEIIYSFNTKLLEDLQSRVEKWNTWQRRDILGDIFTKIFGFLKVYTNYVQNFNLSLQMIDQLKKNAKFQTLVQEIQQKPENNQLDLASYLIMPVQRVPRYNLLLEDLVKHTWNEHPDYEALVKARTQVAEVGKYLNEKKREAENLQKLMEITEAIIGDCPPIAEPHRSFINQYVVEIPKIGETNIYLLNDMVILGKVEAKKQKNFIRYKDSFMIETVDVVEVPDSKGLTNCFDFVAKPKNNSLYKICTKTPQERQDLMNTYKKAKADLETKKTDKERALKRMSGVTEVPADVIQKQELVSVEEKLKQRELEKQMLKTKLNESPAEDRIYMHKKTESLLQMKSIIRKQLADVEEQDEVKPEFAIQLNKNLMDELKEVDESITELKKQLSNEELEVIKKQEEQIEEEIKETKKKRKSLFSSRRHSKTPRESASISPSASGEVSPKTGKKSDKKEKEKKSKK
jgi:hypothetical protein